MTEVQVKLVSAAQASRGGSAFWWMGFVVLWLFPLGFVGWRSLMQDARGRTQAGGEKANPWGYGTAPLV